jgi:hypothetical protein
MNSEGRTTVTEEKVAYVIEKDGVIAHPQLDLEKPFPIEAHAFKPQTTSQDKKRALAGCYVDSRHYQARLDAVDPLWTSSCRVHLTEHQIFIVSTVGILGRTRTATGECLLSDMNAATSAEAQAFKRACTAHGLGRYLYLLPKWWADYDERKRRFTKEAVQGLRTKLGKALGIDGTETPKPHAGSNGDGKPKAQPRSSGVVGPTEFWRAATQQIGSGLKYPTKEAVKALVQVHTTDDGTTDWESALNALQ